ncbi:MAG TPA: proline dehydrogenase family protein [Bacteroidales bacterium]|nr:proline dehydrogenase family protein [Bacteroidales bacterium]HPS50800.1 proline dehydrogenase family protein [Bacteroidales bacterium]
MFNRIITGMLPLMPKKLVWIFSRKYIAGETIEDAIRVCRSLQARGIKATIDLLGEFITELAQAEENKKAYLAIIERIETEKLDANYSLKPTSFGLLIDPEVCYRNVREIVAKAAENGNFVRIDMEDSQCTDLEIQLFRRLLPEFPGHIGLVIQAYLRRTLQDLRNLTDLNSAEHPVNIRLCKGIYIEPEAIAYKKYEEINQHYLEDLEYIFQQGFYPGIATHDQPLVDGACKLIEKYRVPKNRYEFQMLYGVTPELRASVVAKGHTMRVYVPFGKDWFGYSTRRLKENPKIASHIIKALFVRG